MEVSEAELRAPRLITLVKLIYDALARFAHDPVAIVIGSGVVLLMLWGQYGGLPLLGAVWDGWEGPGGDPDGRARIIPGVPFDQELISFAAGVVLLVAIPALIARRLLGQDLRDYGLGPPPPGRRRLAVLSGLVLLAVGAPLFWLAARNPAMQATYPLFRGDLDSTWAFVAYEVGYLAFFVAIEFVFRGWLLFGLFGPLSSRRAGEGQARPALAFGHYAILLSMLSYTAWHLGKPELELWGTLPWGLATGAIVLATRSVWPVIVVHWLLNVILDLAILEGR